NDDYLALLTKLSWCACSFIETGRFEEILDVYNTAVSHSLHGRFGQDASHMIEYFFHSEDFAAKFVDALRLWGRKDREGVFRLAKALRRSVIPPLIDALLSEPDPSMRKFFLSVLKAIGPDVNPYAIKKLNDKRWFAVRNMLYLLRECDGRPYVSHIRKFAKHKNINVCIEAVKTLLYFKTPDAIPFLKLHLQSEKEDLRRAAARLAGAFRIKEAVPYLAGILEKKDIFGTESGSKTDAVRALGEIGDSSAVGALLGLCQARSLFYKGYLEALKMEIFRSLGNYPPDSIRELLAVGLVSDNEEIRSVSEKLMAQTCSMEKREKKE
ncbi:MAG: HEAT repeat domain-containing protein, partial [Nitrospirota bacterium]|nr:HEAT repeat domain-containing protein [Nitrospirota bacterium]